MTTLELTTANSGAWRDFRRVAIRGGCRDISDYVRVNIHPVFSTLHPPANHSTICYNTTPAGITLTAASGGFGGTVTHQWYRRPLNGTWTPIANATNPNLTAAQMGALRVTTDFRRRAQRSGGICNGIVYSNHSRVTVRTQFTTPNNFNPAIQSICYNTRPAAITLGVAEGGWGTLRYQWQRATSSTGPWTTIANSNSANLTAAIINANPALTQTTYFRRQAIREGTDACGGTINSTATRVTVAAQFTTPNFTAAQQNHSTIMGGTRPGAINLGATSGGSGTVTYQWQRRNAGATAWTTIPNSNSRNLTAAIINANVPVLRQNTEFRRRATMSICGGTVDSNHTTVRVTHGTITQAHTCIPHWTGTEPGTILPMVSVRAYCTCGASSINGNISGTIVGFTGTSAAIAQRWMFVPSLMRYVVYNGAQVWNRFPSGVSWDVNWSCGQCGAAGNTRGTACGGSGFFPFYE